MKKELTPLQRAKAQFYQLKSRKHLKDFLDDYTPEFIKKLTDDQFIQLSDFLHDFYNSPGEKHDRASRRHQENDYYSHQTSRDDWPPSDYGSESPEDAIIDYIDKKYKK